MSGDLAAVITNTAFWAAVVSLLVASAWWLVVAASTQATTLQPCSADAADAGTETATPVDAVHSGTKTASTNNEKDAVDAATAAADDAAKPDAAKAVGDGIMAAMRLESIVGKRVILHNLNTTSLNGCVGTAVSVDVASRRVAVQLQAPPDGQCSLVNVERDKLVFHEGRTGVHHVEGFDEKQPRDWLHREGIDPPSSWSTIWFPELVKAGTPAWCPSPCQCGSAGCNLMVSNALDAVTCWACHGAFDARHVDGFEAAVTGTAAMTVRDGYADAGHHFLCDCEPAKRPSSAQARAEYYAWLVSTFEREQPGVICRLAQSAPKTSALFNWARCPRCAQQLGVISLPKQVIGAVGKACLRDLMSAGEQLECHSGVAFVKAVCAEIDYVVKELVKPHEQAVEALEKQSAALACTRGIVAINLLRCHAPDSFILSIADTYYYLHYIRSRLEAGHSERALRKAIRHAVSKMEKKDTSCLDLDKAIRVKFDRKASWGACFLSKADWVQTPDCLRLPNKLSTFDCRLRVSEPQPPYDWPDRDGAYASLDAERRGMVFYQRAMAPFEWVRNRQSRRSLEIVTVFDFRWAFHSSASAKAYFQEAVKSRGEVGAELGDCRCEPTSSSVDGADDSVVLCSTPSFERGRNGMAAYNCLLRVRRVVGKIYFSVQFRGARELAQHDAVLCAVQQVAAAAASHCREAQENDQVLDRSADESLRTAMEAARLHSSQPHQVGGWLPAEGDD